MRQNIKMVWPCATKASKCRSSESDGITINGATKSGLGLDLTWVEAIQKI